MLPMLIFSGYHFRRCLSLEVQISYKMFLLMPRSSNQHKHSEINLSICWIGNGELYLRKSIYSIVSWTCGPHQKIAPCDGLWVGIFLRNQTKMIHCLLLFQKYWRTLFLFTPDEWSFLILQLHTLALQVTIWPFTGNLTSTSNFSTESF